MVKHTAFASSSKEAGQQVGGEIGITFSGGGSRAYTAALGQLRALEYRSNGKGSYLSQVATMVTTSGASWLGIPFSFPNGVTDQNFLNQYVDPSRLVPTRIGNDPIATVLDEFPAGNAGCIIEKDLDVESVVLAMCYLHIIRGVPLDTLWQVFVGEKFLYPYGLFIPDNKDAAPQQAFTRSLKSLDDLEGVNPNGFYQAHVAREDGPYLIVNGSMAVTDADGRAGLIPLYMTPLVTGHPGSPAAVDANGQPITSKQISSFAYASEANSTCDKRVVITQDRPFALTDIMGISSAFFASALQENAELWQGSVAKLIKQISRNAEQLQQLPGMSEDEQTAFNTLVAQCAAAVARHGEGLPDNIDEIDELREADGRAQLEKMQDIDLSSLVPAYHTWQSKGEVNTFDDGGNLENTGVTALLALPSVSRLVAFVNTAIPVTVHGPDKPFAVVSESDVHSNIEITSDIAALFGCQAYSQFTYKSFQDDTGMTRFSQVFPTESLVELLLKIANLVCDSSEPTVVVQELSVMSNDWFGIKARPKPVTVVWNYLNLAHSFSRTVSGQVGELIAGFEGFPNVATEKMTYSATETNLMAAFTGWVVAGSDARTTFDRVFELD